MSRLAVLRILIAGLLGGLIGHLAKHGWANFGTALLLAVAVAAYVLAWFVPERKR